MGSYTLVCMRTIGQNFFIEKFQGNVKGNILNLINSINTGLLSSLIWCLTVIIFDNFIFKSLIRKYNAIRSISEIAINNN